MRWPVLILVCAALSVATAVIADGAPPADCEPAWPAQVNEVPAQSPAAAVLQNVGFARVTVEYSRPRVRGREIWGGLVPYGEVWRTGADYPTRIELSEDLEVEGRRLPAGRYALYTIPGERSWTVIFSRNVELWGAFGYDPAEDALRVEVGPRRAPFTESFTIDFAEVTAHAATLELRWAELAVPVRLRAEVVDRVVQAVSDEPEPTWGLYWRGALVLMEAGGQPDLVSEWLERSLALERNWMNLWAAATHAAARGDLETASAIGAEALAACRDNPPYCAYPRTYRRQLDRWRDAVSETGGSGGPAERNRRR